MRAQCLALGPPFFLGASWLSSTYHGSGFESQRRPLYFIPSGMDNKRFACSPHVDNERGEIDRETTSRRLPQYMIRLKSSLILPCKMSGDNFVAKAQAAATSVSSLNPAEALAQSLTNDRPTIDSAIKAYMSLTAARNWSVSDPNILKPGAAGEGSKDSLHRAIYSDQKQERCFFAKSKNATMAALLCARCILKKVNTYEVPEDCNSEEKDDDKILEFKVVRIMWNGLVNSGKKPSMILGRQSLRHVYPLILEALQEEVPGSVDSDEARVFMKEFGRLLDDATKRRDLSLSKEQKETLNSQDDDSCLLWDNDGGNAELKRRRERREKNANIVKKNLEEDRLRNVESAAQSLTIEEIPEGDENGDGEIGRAHV